LIESAGSVRIPLKGVRRRKRRRDGFQMVTEKNKKRGGEISEKRKKKGTHAKVR